MRSASRLFFSSKLFVKELPNELLVIELLTDELLLIIELLTDELLLIVELFDKKIQGILLAKCCSSLDRYRNSLPYFLHIRSLLERLLASFFL